VLVVLGGACWLMGKQAWFDALPSQRG